MCVFVCDEIYYLLIYLCSYLFIYLKELAHTMWWLASLNFTEQIGRVETQGRVDIAVSSPKAGWRQNFFLRKPQSFSLNAFN